MGIQNLISKAQKAAPQILRAVLATVILFPGTSFGYTRMNDEVICENDRDGQVRKFASELVQKASYTADKDGKLNLKRVMRKKWLTALGPVEANQSILVNGAEGKGTGNAVMVSPCHVLTNHHMVFGDKVLPRTDKSPEMKSRLKDRFSVTFTTVDEKGDLKKPIIARPIEWGDRYEAGNNSEDWALLELNECHGEKVGWVDIQESVSDEIKSKKLAGAWYEDGLPADSLIFHHPCAVDVVSSTGKALLTTCSNKTGSSGSGIYMQEPNERPKLVGLQVGSYKKDHEVATHEEGGVNAAVSANSFYPKISGIIERAKQSYLSKLRTSGRNVPDDFNPAFNQ